MDDHQRRRRQNEATMHPTSNPRYPQSASDPSQQRRSYAAAAAPTNDRFRPAPLNTSPSAAARSMGGTASYSGYYQEPAAGAFPTATALPQNTMGYHQTTADYGQDARQTQGFASAYNAAGMMYNVQQAGAQNPVYDTSQQFSSRQPAAMQMMTPDVATPYFPNESANTAAASALQPQTATSSASSAVYQQSPADRSALLQGYQGGMAMGGLATQTGSSAADVSMEDQEYPAAGGLDEAYASYQTALKEIFQNIRSGALATAGTSLLEVSDWLLSHVSELGLNSDDQNLHNDRIKLWNDFNHAWLGMFQKQKEMMESDQAPQRTQSLITQENLEKMGKDLVRLCDSVERHGLVDYQYGVWEEQIISILTDCLDLYEASEESGGNAAASSSHRG